MNLSSNIIGKTIKEVIELDQNQGVLIKFTDNSSIHIVGNFPYVGQYYDGKMDLSVTIKEVQ